MELFSDLFWAFLFLANAKLKLMFEQKDDESPPNSAVLSQTSMISSSAISVPSSHSAHLISPNVNNNNHQTMMNNSSQNGNLVPHSQSAHQLGHQQHASMQQQQQQAPHTPLGSHHQMLQQQLQKHFQHNNMGEFARFLL